MESFNEVMEGNIKDKHQEWNQLSSELKWLLMGVEKQW